MENAKKRVITVITLIVVALLVLVTSLVVLAFSRSKNKTLLVINGYEVKEEEYIWAMNRCRNKVLEDLLQSGEDAFDWQKETPEGVPYEILSDRAVEFLKEVHAVHSVALDYDYLDDVGFENLQNRFEAENKSKSEDKASGKVVYGLSQFSFDQYVDYELDAVQERYCENKDNPDNNVEEDELLKLYNETKDSLYILEDDIELSYIKVDYVSNDFSDDELENIRKQIQQLSKAITEGGSLDEELLKFQALADYHEKQSIAGAERVQYARTMEDILEYSSKLKEGELSNVIDQNGRIFLIECVKRVNNDYIPFDEISSLLEKQIQEKRYTQLIQSKINESVVEYKNTDIHMYTMKRL